MCKPPPWLRALNKANGQSASPGTKAKIRNIMSALFSHAKRYEWASRNPIEDVRTSTKRQRIPEILTGAEFQALIEKLNPRDRLMVALAGATGLRRGEIIALRWRDIDFGNNEAYVLHSVWRNVMGDAKRKLRAKPVPLPAFFIDAMRDWRSVSLYNGDDDFLFPSVRSNGQTPISPDSILKKPSALHWLD
jgi:integrase